MIKFTIGLVPVTKKNSQRIVKLGSRYSIMPSVQYKAYEKAAMLFIPTNKYNDLTEPLEIKAVFYMPTRRRVDLTNLLEALDDVLVKSGMIADDNSRIVVSHDGSRVRYDKEHPRTEVTIRRIDWEEIEKWE